MATSTLIDSHRFLRTSRPLRLCGSPRGILTQPKSSFSTEAIFHRASHYPHSRVLLRLLSAMETCFCLSPSPDKQKVNSLRPLRLCGEILKESFSSLNLAPLASSQLAPWNNAVSEKITLLWNTAPTEVELFAYSTIPQGESSYLILTLCAMRLALCCSPICVNLRLICLLLTLRTLRLCGESLFAKRGMSHDDNV